MQTVIPICQLLIQYTKQYVYNHLTVCAPFFVYQPQNIVTGKESQAMFRRYFTRGGWKRLPKFKFLAKFPIGLHVILQIQIKKFENDCYLM